MKGFLLVLGTMTLICSPTMAADPCVLPDNGLGTVYLPPEGCDYLSPSEVHMIIDGLPPGTTIELAPIHTGFFVLSRDPGGVLGGEIELFESVLVLDLNGTGDLAGFSRIMEVPALCEVHICPGDPGAPFQMHLANMQMLEGTVQGDPDFDLMSITAGGLYGLPSTGETFLTQLPGGDFNVDSFFDITYEISFVGAPGGVLDGLSGTTQGTIRMQTGGAPVGACCSPDGSCVVSDEVDCSTGLWLIGEQCSPNPCPQPEAACCFPDGSCIVTTELDCSGDWLGMGSEVCEPNPCPQPPNECIQPDNGSGTVNLPPEGCQYLSPQEVHEIIDGLPPGTTIELDPIHSDFITTDRSPGGSLGGEIELFESMLHLELAGTGDLAGWNRTLAVPLACEVHTAPRELEQSFQQFDTDMWRSQGALVGDPDFDQLIVTAGTEFGLPSPGVTALTRLPSGDFNVDSFFDITYTIDFVGAPGSVLEGLAGSTTATIRMESGETVPIPTAVCCSTLGECSITIEADCSHVWLFGTLTCDPDPCGPFPTEESSWGAIKARFK